MNSDVLRIPSSGYGLTWVSAVELTRKDVAVE